ncbi:DUF1707 SHOCT-like domain-containing protein [Sphaerisporangium aureirubrum]|uniref:DUF1707 domain-containing protein n=1 Tax=Sphaerisporangium aureirubrum TaxID=1544736 RepID=A0ABW1NP52_9ACTN
MTMRDDLRIGDAERDEVMDALREHFAQGRLTHEELDERLGAALAARTSGDLRRVLADLPVTAAPPAGHGGRRPARGAYGERPPPLGHPAARGPFGPGRPPMPSHADLATWGYHLAGRRGWGRDTEVEYHQDHDPEHERRRRPPHRRHHGRPPVFLFVIGALLLAGAVTGSLWPVFGLLKVLFVAWLVIGLLRFAHHRHHGHHHHHHGHLRRGH